MDMERRFFLRGRSAPHLWQRVVVRLMITVPVGVIAVILVIGATQVISHLVGR
jgi:hypothetical protein